jgi:hypothetical protein
MKTFVVIKREALDEAGDTLDCLGVFSKIEDARKAMKDDFEGQEYDEEECEEYEVEDDRIYVVGDLGFSYTHYWSEIVEQEVK